MIAKGVKKSILIYLQNWNCKNRLIKTVKDRRAVLWGASIFICKIIDEFNPDTDNILGIIDRDSEKRGKKIGKYEIFSPQDLQKLNPDLVVSAVLFNSKMKEYISDELNKSGITAEIRDDLFSGIKDF